MKLTVIGCSPAVQNPGGACSSYLVSHGDRRLLVDCGHGSVGILRSVVDLRDLSAVIISHMHPDHIFDLLPLTYGFKFGGLPAIPLVLPPDAESVLAPLQSAVGLSQTFFSDSFDVRTYDPSSPLHLAGFDIEFARTRHYIPAQAMRFTVPGEGGSIAYSADTAWSDAVKNLLRDASLAVVEASVPRYTAPEQREGHLTPALAGTLAREAGVERLVITHYATSDAESTEAEATAAFGRPVELARERAEYEV